MKKTVLLFVLTFILSSFAGAQSNKDEALKLIKAEDLKAYVTYLASDQMKGRYAGTAENEAAAAYIAKRFSELGLKPYVEPRRGQANAEPEEEDGVELKSAAAAAPANSFDKYFQKFFLLKSQVDSAGTRLVVNRKAGESSVETGYFPKKDFVITSKLHQDLALSSGIVFIGFGIEKGEAGYSDYLSADGKKVDVKNKIALIVDSFPDEEDTAGVYAKSKNAGYKNLRKKYETAFERGALAVFVVASPITRQPPFIIRNERMIIASSNPEYSLPETRTETSKPVVQISNEVCEEILRNSDKSLKELVKGINSSKKGSAFEVPSSEIKLNITVLSSIVPTVNVVGMVEGSDPVLKNEYVVVGAHFDHVGIGQTGAMSKDNYGLVHNGADDNASGTSGILEVAEAMMKAGQKRSVIFAAFNAEELGMMGSRYYAYQYAMRPIDRTVAMVNLDMIGRNEPELLWIGGIFYSSDMKDVLEAANKSIGLQLLYNVGLLTFASDQGPFIRKNVPSVFLFAGLHDDYHTPADDVEKINFRKVERVAKLAFETVYLLAETDKLPQYRVMNMDEKIILVKESLEKQKKFRSDQEKK